MSNYSTTSRTLGGEITLGGDLTVHRLGFGAMRITGSGIWGPRDGIAFLPWFPLGGKGTPTHAAFERIAAQKAATPAQIALAWLLARSPNVLPIPGTSSIPHFDENLAAAEVELTSEDMAALG